VKGWGIEKAGGRQGVCVTLLSVCTVMCVVCINLYHSTWIICSCVYCIFPKQSLCGVHYFIISPYHSTWIMEASI